jgi:hypothetical protein
MEDSAAMWQKEYDALMARKPPAAGAPAPAPEAEAPKPPMATDSALVSRVQNATLACAKLGIPMAGLSTVDALELAVAKQMVGDSLPAQPADGFYAGLVAAALVQAAAQPTKTPVAPVTTAMQLAPRNTVADSAPASFEAQMYAAYGLPTPPSTK